MQDFRGTDSLQGDARQTAPTAGATRRDSGRRTARVAAPAARPGRRAAADTHESWQSHCCRSRSRTGWLSDAGTLAIATGWTFLLARERVRLQRAGSGTLRQVERRWLKVGERCPTTTW